MLAWTGFWAVYVVVVMPPAAFAKPIGVTGATGRLGGRVAQLLAADRCSQRLLIRDPAAAPDLPGVEVVVIPDYADGPACQEALEA